MFLSRSVFLSASGFQVKVSPEILWNISRVNQNIIIEIKDKLRKLLWGSVVVFKKVILMNSNDRHLHFGSLCYCALVI